MRKSMHCTAVASMLLAGLTIRPSSSLADQPANAGAPAAAAPATPAAGQVLFTLPPGITAKDLEEDKDIRSAFGTYVGAATEKNGFENALVSLVDQDRPRIKEYKVQKPDSLKDAVDSLHKQWKDKYKHDFDITRIEKQKGLKAIVIQTGKVSAPDQLVGNWPIPQAALTAEAQTAASKQDIEQAKKKFGGGDVNLEKGREVAIAQVPQTFGLPEVRCSLIKENAAGWRFDIPNNITGQMLHDNLARHLAMVAMHPEQWPADEEQGYGLVGHHALMALYNVDMPVPPPPSDPNQVK